LDHGVPRTKRRGIIITEASLLWTPGQPVVEPVPVRGFYHVASCRVKDLAEADRSIVQSRRGSYDALPAADHTRTRGAAVLSRGVSDIGNWIVWSRPGESIASSSRRHAALPISSIG